MRHPLRWTVLCLFAPVFSSQAASDLYFSEYIEGSSYNKALEIYNATGSAVDLSTYQIRLYFNGNSTAGRTINLSGTLADGKVFVVADSNASAEVQAKADLLGGTNWYNGDDAVELSHNGVAVDVIGQIGFDPGSRWGTSPVSTQNNTLRRKTSVTDGDANGLDTFDPSLEWEGFAQDSFDDLASYGGGGGEPPVARCGDPADMIHAVQGNGNISPLLDQQVSIEAVVVADLQATISGIYVQEEDADIDADPATSEGLFVYTGSTPAMVNVGDRVRINGQVKEYFDLTELSNVTNVEVCESGLSVTPATVNLPFANAAEAEHYEGMSVTLPQNLTVSENYNLGRYAEVLLSNGRLFQPTHLAAPGIEAAQIAEANLLNQLTLDDGSNRQNPDPIIFPAPGLSALHTLRGGDTVQGLQGVMHYSYNKYRVFPTMTPDFNASNPRPTGLTSLPVNQLRVASFNVLNYFTTLDQGGNLCGPSGNLGCRGADSASEFARQQAKIVQAILAMHADIIGLMELENNGFAVDSAIANLVNAINAQAPAGVEYAYIDPGVSAIGSDAISVGLIYNINKAKPVGQAAILDSSVDARFIDSRNRPALAVSFKDLQTRERLTVSVNHLKSKGSSCADLGDPDLGDGQGNCNITRTQAAEALADWLATYPTGIKDPDILIIGDMNAYAKEDPISALKAAGYQNLIESQLGESAYSYVYFGQAGYLDHALATEQAAAQVVNVMEYHINGDEPHVLDYNEEYKSAGQIGSLYNADAYRSSDHDPVIIDLQLTRSVAQGERQHHRHKHWLAYMHHGHDEWEHHIRYEHGKPH